MPMVEAARIGDVIVTVTGNTRVLTPAHAPLFKNGAVLCNSGHFDVEIDIPGLRALAVDRWEARPFVEALKLADGRVIHLLAEGRLVNLAAAEGHPAVVMDMSFANQAMAAEHLVQRAGSLRPQVFRLPEELDKGIAALKLETMGRSIDVLTAEQEAYLASWREGT